MKKLYMALVALLFVGCVDKSIDLEQLETSVGINCNELTLPLGYLEKISVDQIIGDDIENITADPVTGDYAINIDVDNNIFEIKGSGNNFVIPKYMHKVDIDYPAFKLSDARYGFDEKYTVGGNYMGADMEFIEGHMVDVPAGINISGVQDGTIGYNFDIPVPEFVERIERIYVEHDPKLPGAPIEAVLDLGSLAEVSAGGDVTVELIVPEGYEFYGEDKQPLVDNVFKIDGRRFSANQHRVTFTCYVGSIENHESAEGGVIHIPSQIEYHISYNLTTRAGSITLEELPYLEISTDMACQDADVALSAMKILPEPLKVENKISIDAMNDYVGKIKHLHLLNSTIKLKVEGMDWWSDEAVAAGALEDIYVEVTLPTNFDIEVQTEGVRFDKAQSMLHATLAQLKRGVKIGVNSINFDQGLSVGNSGNVEADMSFTINAGLEQGSVIRLKHLQHEGGASIYAGYEESRILVTAVTGTVDYSHTEHLSFELPDMDIDDKLDITALGINPMIELMLKNSISMPMNCSAQLVPYRNGLPIEQTTLGIGPINIAAAQIGDKYPDYTPAQTIVRIGAGLQPQEGVQSIDCDLAKLLQGELPDKIDVELNVSSDPNQDVTLLLLPSYPIEYGYSFGLPLNFGSWLDWTYSDSIKGLNGTFADIDVQVDNTFEISLLCDVLNSTPLNVELDLELLDVDGNECAIVVAPMGSTIIKGSADGVTPAHSTFEMKLDMSNVDDIKATLAKLDSLRYTLHISSAATGVALNRNQTFEANFKLKINGNVNVEL